MEERVCEFAEIIYSFSKIGLIHCKDLQVPEALIKVGSTSTILALVLFTTIIYNDGKGDDCLSWSSLLISGTKEKSEMRVIYLHLPVQIFLTWCILPLFLKEKKKRSIISSVLIHTLQAHSVCTLYC